MASSLLAMLLLALVGILLFVPTNPITVGDRAYPVTLARFLMAQACLFCLLDVIHTGEMSRWGQLWFVTASAVVILANRWANRILWGEHAGRII